MGTSSSGSGPRPSTPLIPSWITDQDSELSQDTDSDNTSPSDKSQEGNDDTSTSDDSEDGSSVTETPNRYSEARSKFTSFSRNRTTSHTLRDSLSSYVRKAGGGSSTMAKRMRSSASRVARFAGVVNALRQNITEVLKEFNLTAYATKPFLDILGALTDIIFDDSTGLNDIQDDSITKLAYANTINRIAEFEQIDLDSLTNENIEVMMAIFIEETIVAKVLCDVGTSLFKAVQDSKEILEVEETTYQVVSGLVRTMIMPEIVATQRGQFENIEKNIEKIYRIAFDCIVGTTL